MGLQRLARTLDARCLNLPVGLKPHILVRLLGARCLDPLVERRLCRLPSLLGPRPSFGMTHRAIVARRATPSKFFFSSFCSQNDGSMNRWREHGCVFCRAAPMSNASVLCQPCLDVAPDMAGILKLPEDHRNFKGGTSTLFYYWLGEYGDLSNDS
jgi:hypothetical protein